MNTRSDPNSVATDQRQTAQTGPINSGDPIEPPQRSGSGTRSLLSNVGAILLGRMMRKIIRTGTLRVTLPDGQVVGSGEGVPLVAVRVVTQATLWRIMRNPDLALGEAYMDRSLVMEDGTIHDFLDLVMSNLKMSRGHGMMRAHAWMRQIVRRLIQHNPVATAKANVAHHYDLSDTLYALFLDAGRQYSCAYYLSPTDTLEQAQDQKKRHVAAKLLLRPGDRVLDIGSGWGGLGLHLAQTADVNVCGLTLSVEQHGYAQNSAAQAGLADRVQFHLRDYRHETGRYERIVSVGMFEHVGIGHYREYFNKVAGLLTEDGVALIHTIGTARGPTTASPWLNKYIFPGGYAPALSEILPAIERAGLYVADVEVLRLHYAYTLRAWRDRFMAERARAIEVYDERFCRMWEFYLAYCEAGFRHSGLVVFQIQLCKRIDAVHLTRDYIAASECLQATGVTQQPAAK